MSDAVDKGVIKGVVSQVVQRQYNYLVGGECELTTLLQTHWYHYLNAIAQDPNGVLASSNFRDVKGNKVSLRHEDGKIIIEAAEYTNECQ